MTNRKYRVHLVQKKKVARETVSFHFEKPQGYSHKAGQFIVLKVLDLEADEKETEHFFSLSSAPYEDALAITTRIRGTKLKQKLNSYDIGHEIQISDAMGSFLLDEENKPVVFLAGGIGITPFRSMILQETYEKSPRTITLFYSNPTQLEAAYLEELQEGEKNNRNFKLVPIMTRDETWEGEKDHISFNMIKKNISDVPKVVFYSAGPPQMVETLKSMLLTSGILQERIKVEEFEGY